MSNTSRMACTGLARLLMSRSGSSASTRARLGAEPLGQVGRGQLVVATEALERGQLDERLAVQRGPLLDAVGRVVGHPIVVADDPERGGEDGVERGRLVDVAVRQGEHGRERRSTSSGAGVHPLIFAAPGDADRRTATAVGDTSRWTPMRRALRRRPALLTAAANLAAWHDVVDPCARASTTPGLVVVDGAHPRALDLLHRHLAAAHRARRPSDGSSSRSWPPTSTIRLG